MGANGACAADGPAAGPELDDRGVAVDLHPGARRPHRERVSVGAAPANVGGREGGGVGGERAVSGREERAVLFVEEIVDPPSVQRVDVREAEGDGKRRVDVQDDAVAVDAGGHGQRVDEAPPLIGRHRWSGTRDRIGHGHEQSARSACG